MLSKTAVPLKHCIDPSGPGYGVALSWQHEQSKGRTRSRGALDLFEVHPCVDQWDFLTQDRQICDLSHSTWGEGYNQEKRVAGQPWELQARRQKANRKRCERGLEPQQRGQHPQSSQCLEGLGRCKSRF